MFLTYVFHIRFPYFAADVLASNAMILQALLEGGWNNDKGDEEDTSAKKDNKSGEDLGGTAAGDVSLVQSALDSQTVSYLK